MLRCSTLIIQWKCVFWKLTLKLSCFKLSRWFLSKTNEITREKRQLLYVNEPKRLFKFVSTGSNTYFGGNLYVCGSSVSFNSYLRITSVQWNFSKFSYWLCLECTLKGNRQKLYSMASWYSQVVELSDSRQWIWTWIWIFFRWKILIFSIFIKHRPSKVRFSNNSYNASATLKTRHADFSSGSKFAKFSPFSIIFFFSLVTSPRSFNLREYCQNLTLFSQVFPKEVFSGRYCV